jgi:hypothetical protein
MNKKIGRNDKCYCGNNKKYKICCLKKDISIKNESAEKLTYGHNIASDNIQTLYECLRELYKKYRIIDITEYLSDLTYESYQKKHYYDKVIMIAEINNINESVFKKRGPDNVNMMVMFSGAYRSFCFDDLSFAIDNVIAMIEDRINNK